MDYFGVIVFVIQQGNFLRCDEQKIPRHIIHSDRFYLNIRLNKN